MIYREPLTPREQQVYDLLRQGLSNREIAAALIIEVTTVRQHLNHIYAKLGVGSRLQAVLKANVLVPSGQEALHR